MWYCDENCYFCYQTHWLQHCNLCEWVADQWLSQFCVWWLICRVKGFTKYISSSYLAFEKVVTFDLKIRKLSSSEMSVKNSIFQTKLTCVQRWLAGSSSSRFIVCITLLPCSCQHPYQWIWMSGTQTASHLQLVMSQPSQP